MLLTFVSTIDNKSITIQWNIIKNNCTFNKSKKFKKNKINIDISSLVFEKMKIKLENFNTKIQFNNPIHSIDFIRFAQILKVKDIQSLIKDQINFINLINIDNWIDVLNHFINISNKKNFYFFEKVICNFFEKKIMPNVQVKDLTEMNICSKATEYLTNKFYNQNYYYVKIEKLIDMDYLDKIVKESNKSIINMDISLKKNTNCVEEFKKCLIAEKIIQSYTKFLADKIDNFDMENNNMTIIEDKKEIVDMVSTSNDPHNNLENNLTKNMENNYIQDFKPINIPPSKIDSDDDLRKF